MQFTEYLDINAGPAHPDTEEERIYKLVMDSTPDEINRISHSLVNTLMEEPDDPEVYYTIHDFAEIIGVLLVDQDGFEIGADDVLDIILTVNPASIEQEETGAMYDPHVAYSRYTIIDDEEHYDVPSRYTMITPFSDFVSFGDDLDDDSEMDESEDLDDLDELQNFTKDELIGILEHNNVSIDDLDSTDYDTVFEKVSRIFKKKNANRKKRKFMTKSKADLRKEQAKRKQSNRKTKAKRKKYYRINKKKLKQYKKQRSAAVKSGLHHVKLRRRAG